MANIQEAMDYRNARNGDLTSVSWPGQIGQHAYWQGGGRKAQAAAGALQLSGFVLRLLSCGTAMRLHSRRSCTLCFNPTADV